MFKSGLLALLFLLILTKANQVDTKSKEKLNHKSIYDYNYTDIDSNASSYAYNDTNYNG